MWKLANANDRGAPVDQQLYLTESLDRVPQKKDFRNTDRRNSYSQGEEAFAVSREPHSICFCSTRRSKTIHFYADGYPC